MTELEIHGGKPLRGEVEIGGAKNAALPLMAASLLTREPVRLSRVPRTKDIETMVSVLRQLGSDVQWADEHTLDLHVISETACAVPDACIQAMRASICALGPLLARRGAVHISKPGGCAIGERPIDMHLKGLRALGAAMRDEERMVTGSTRGLRGAEIDMAGPNGPTVLGTANVLSAAVLARGRTIIRHAAREPEIVALASFLGQMGARITGAGEETVIIDGVEGLGGARFALPTDRIEAGTFMAAAAITGGDVLVRGACAEHLDAFCAALHRMGVMLTVDRDGIRAARGARLVATDVTTEPHPGFPTDLQAPLMALMCLAEGRSTMTETVFPKRFSHVAQLQRMGAAIRVEGPRAEIMQVPALSGAAVCAPDLRAGAALIVAGLAAGGVTRIQGVEHIDRGYERLEEKLTALGASIRRLE